MVLKSTLDKSVNFIEKSSNGKGFYEARFVMRNDDYFIVYLSSHAGCNQLCQFCHLTKTGQFDVEQATLDCYLEQASKVFDHYDNLVKEGMKSVERVHFNFMSRGEALLNDVVINDFKTLSNSLALFAINRNIRPIFKVSSIFPKATFRNNISLASIFPISNYDIDICYSLYSTNESFRSKWIPNALVHLDAFKLIKEYQDITGRYVTFHWAYIKGENDSLEDTNNIAKLIREYNIRGKFNLVRYNSYDESVSGKESDEDILSRNFKIISSAFVMNNYGVDLGSRIVPRVGFDVKASCGMFISK